MAACYLIVYNLSKKHNIGTLSRAATAFNVKEVCLVGSKHFNVFGSQGSDAHVSVCHYNTIEECCADLRGNKGCEIVGVEIDDSAQRVDGFPFKGPTAFMLGNEGHGLTPRQMAVCDSFVYIPQYGAGTASLNVAVAASIVLHHFALWAQYPERAREGAKYLVGERPDRSRPRGRVPITAEEAAARQQRREGGGPDVQGLDFSDLGAVELLEASGNGSGSGSCGGSSGGSEGAAM